MSYDMAAWEGERPANDDDALDEYASLAEQYLEAEEIPPTPRIVRYREALMQRWPDTDLAASPWASGQTGDASGPILSVQIQHDRAEEVAGHVAALADEHGLVCYDLRQDRLRP